MIQSKPFVSSLFVSVPTRSFGYGNCAILIRARVHALNPAVAATRLQNYPSTRVNASTSGDAIKMGISAYPLWLPKNAIGNGVIKVFR